jgi:hypothetical protein
MIQKIKKKYEDDTHSDVYYIIDTNKEFELKYNDMFNLNRDKLMISIKKKYQNHKYYLNVSQINAKIKSRFFKKNNWENLKKNYSFELTVNNNFNLIEFNKNDFNFNNVEEIEDINIYDIKRKNSRVWFGIGNEFEGFVFTYGNYFCLNRNGKVENGVIEQFGRPENTWKDIQFSDNKLQLIFNDCINLALEQYFEWEKNLISKINISEKNLSNSKTDIFLKFDKDNNGVVDFIEDENDFNKLFIKNEIKITEKGKEFNQNYIHNFVKVENFLKEKRKNIQLIFEQIRFVEKESELSEYVEILENEIHLYNLLLLNSISLLVSLIEDNQITYYNIYEKFDKLNIFNSNWENEISNKLNDININLYFIMNEIRIMGNKIVKSIDDLTFITKESMNQIDKRLGEIDSTIKTNNFLTLINTYQSYKINKNTKNIKN